MICLTMQHVASLHGICVSSVSVTQLDTHVSERICRAHLVLLYDHSYKLNRTTPLKPSEIKVQNCKKSEYDSLSPLERGEKKDLIIDGINESQIEFYKDG